MRRRQTTDAELRLYFRYSAHGEAAWHEVRLEECEPVPPRIVTVVCRQGGMPPGATLDFWEHWLDRAGALRPDLVLLPEMFDGVTPDAARAARRPRGRIARAQVARVANVHERRLL